MSAMVVSISAGVRKPKKAKVTCITCGLKKCIGRCRWERPRSGPPEAA